MAAWPQSGPGMRASLEGHHWPSWWSMVKRAGSARMRTPAGVGTHSARRTDHWKPGDHIRGGGPAPKGPALVNHRRAAVSDAMPSRR
eukprot:13573075-Alexandrium_andersonii.AAC.1